jgi:hypothetical protein
VTTVTDDTMTLVSTCQPADSSDGSISCVYASSGNTVVVQTTGASVETSSDGTMVETCTVPDSGDSSQYCYVTDGTGAIYDSSEAQIATCAAADSSTGNYECTDDVVTTSIDTYDSSQVFVQNVYTYWGMTTTTLADETSTTVMTADGAAYNTCAAPDSSDSSVLCTMADGTTTTVTQTDGSSVTNDGLIDIETCAAPSTGTQDCTDSSGTSTDGNVTTTTIADGSSVTVDSLGATVETCGAKADDGTQTCTSP